MQPQWDSLVIGARQTQPSHVTWWVGVRVGRTDPGPCRAETLGGNPKVFQDQTEMTETLQDVEGFLRLAGVWGPDE